MSEEPRKARPRKLDAEALHEWALRALAGHGYSAAELREKLRRKAAQATDVDSLIARLKEYGILDDRRFADAFAAARLENQSQGKLRVLRSLAQHRVPSGIARRAVDAVYEKTDESDLIEAFLRRKLRKVALEQYLADPRNLAAVFRKLRYAGFTAANSIRVLRHYSELAGDLESLEASDAEAES